MEAMPIAPNRLLIPIDVSEPLSLRGALIDTLSLADTVFFWLLADTGPIST